MTLPDRIWVPAAAGALLALLFAGALLLQAGGDASLLVHAGAPCTTRAAAPPLRACDATIDADDLDGDIVTEGAPGSLTVQGADDAFDGQFFYRIGVAPWSDDARVAGVQNDLPALRNARWGYGALAWAVSFGDRDLVPWSLLVVNVAAVAAIGAIGGALARTAAQHAAWGLAFVVWPGFAYSLSLDTSELVAMAFALGGLLALRRRRQVPAAVLLTAAVLTRDTTLVIALGVLASGMWSLRPNSEYRVGGRAAVRAGSWPVVAFVVWQEIQRARFGEFPLTSSGDNNLAAPLAGLLDQLQASLPPGGGDEAFRLLNIVLLVGLLVAAGWAARADERQRLGPEQVAWLGAVAVVVLLNPYLWSGATAFMRAATEAGVLSVLLLLRAGRMRLLSVAAIGLGGMWLLTAAAQVSKLG